MALSETEMEIYKRGTGREVYDGVEQQEVTVIAGRRGGKTTKVACPTAIFEAFRDHHLPPGETGYVVLLAPTMSQARIAFRCIRNYLRSSPILSKSIRRITKNEIELTNGITICCYPCSYIAVRGITIVAAICDEMAFWPHDESAANPEVEILEALRPGMVVGAKLIKISTPFRKEGLLWDEFQQASAVWIFLFGKRSRKICTRNSRQRRWRKLSNATTANIGGSTWPSFPKTSIPGSIPKFWQCV